MRGTSLPMTLCWTYPMQEHMPIEFLDSRNHYESPHIENNTQRTILSPEPDLGLQDPHTAANSAVSYM